MGEEMHISNYKGFDLWDTPKPDGWKIHPYPVRVTFQGVHINVFADTNHAMMVIDTMDKETLEYHQKRAAHMKAVMPAPAAADAAPARADGRELPYERFMEILREVLHFPPDEELFDEWAVIEAIRQDNAIIMTREAETERLQAELAAAREALNVAESTLHSISQRLPMTDSYKDVNMNREELRSLATKYFDTPEARATVARQDAG